MDNITIAFVIGYSSLAIAVLLLMLKLNKVVRDTSHNFEAIQRVFMMQAMHMKTIEETAKAKVNV